MFEDRVRPCPAGRQDTVVPSLAAVHPPMVLYGLVYAFLTTLNTLRGL